jgi:hypothetical protein
VLACVLFTLAAALGGHDAQAPALRSVPGILSMEVLAWEANDGDGLVTYKVEAGTHPACAKGCSLRIEMTQSADSDGQDGRIVGTLPVTYSTSPPPLDNWTATASAQQAPLPEVTHLRAVLSTPFGENTTAWTQVSDPCPYGASDVVKNPVPTVYGTAGRMTNMWSANARWAANVGPCPNRDRYLRFLQGLTTGLPDTSTSTSSPAFNCLWSSGYVITMYPRGKPPVVTRVAYPEPKFDC